MCKGLEGAKQGWGGGGGREEADGQGANSSPPGASRHLGPREGAPGGPGLGYHELPEDLLRYQGPGSPHTLAKLQSGWCENDSLESPCDSGRLLKVAGACQLSLSSGRRHTPALQPQCRDSGRFSPVQSPLQLGQSLRSPCLGLYRNGCGPRAGPLERIQGMTDN